MMEAAKFAEVDFALNIVRNSKREVVKALSGDVSQVFESGVKLLDEMCKVYIERSADVVFISPGERHTTVVFMRHVR